MMRASWPRVVSSRSSFAGAWAVAPVSSLQECASLGRCMASCSKSNDAFDPERLPPTRYGETTAESTAQVSGALRFILGLRALRCVGPTSAIAAAWTATCLLVNAVALGSRPA